MARQTSALHSGSILAKNISVCGGVEGSPPVQVCKLTNNLNCDYDPDTLFTFLANLCVVLAFPCPLATVLILADTRPHA